LYVQPVWVDCPIPRDLLPLFGKTLHAPFDLLINHWDPDHIEITREARQVSRVAVAWSMWEFAAAPEHIKKPCRKHLMCAECGAAESAHGPDAEGVLHPFKASYRSKWAIGDPSCPDCRHVDSGLYPMANGIGRTKERAGLRERLRWFDMVAGYDPVSLAALAPFIGPKVHQTVLQGGYDSRLWKPMDRNWHEDRFQFLMHGALNDRKQPWLVIQAWHKLKAEKGEAFAPARLALHTVAPGKLFPELNVPFASKGIKVFVSSLDLQGVKDLYAASHCLLAPSRGEGKNLPCLEMLSTAGAVAATNFGGHTQWIGGDWAYPLDYKLGATYGDCPWGAHDAQVQEDHLAEVIWHIYTHREEARKKAALGSEMIPKLCDWSVVVESLFRRIRDQVKGPGPQVYDKAMACRRDEESSVTFPVPVLQQ
jgi:glycosyltransferase involved in cell wall biosynthesis